MSRSSFRPVNFLRAACAPRHSLRLALVISLCAHLVILFPPHWNVWQPRPLPNISRLNVTLQKAPSAEPAPAPASAPVPSEPQPIVVPVEASPPTSLNAPVKTQDEPEMPEAVETVETPESAETSALAEEDEPWKPVSVIFAPGGTMRYIMYLYLGNWHTEVGLTELQWEMGDGGYSLYLRTENSPNAPLSFPVAADEGSWGHFSAEGLQPNHYRFTREDKAPEEVEFAWEIGQIILSGRDQRPRHPIHSGSQDILSLPFQLAYLMSNTDATPGRSLEFRVATSERYELLRFTILGEETLELPAGVFRTLHLQAVSKARTIDYWLAKDERMLPVKTRFTDKGGRAYERVASEIPVEKDEQPEQDNPPDPEADSLHPAGLH